MAKQSPFYQEYRRERRRIQQWLRRAERRGYQVNYTLPTRPKNIRRESVERLRRVTPEKLYKKSTVFNYQEDKTVKGAEFRKYERSRAAKKGAETRRRKAQQFGGTESRYVAPTGTPQPTFTEREAQDAYDYSHADEIAAGKIMLDELYNMIGSMAHTHPRSAARVQNALDHFMSTGDRDENLAFIAQHGDKLEHFAEIAMSYGVGHETHESAITELLTILNGGTVPDAETAKSWEDVMSQDNDITAGISIKRSIAARNRKRR